MLASRRRNLLILGTLLVTLGVMGFRWAARQAEEKIAARIATTATRLGVRITYENLHVGLFPPVRIKGIVIEKLGQWSAQIDAVSVRPRFFGPNSSNIAGRVVVEPAHVTLPADFEIQTQRSVWDVDPAGTIALKSPVEGLTMAATTTANGSVVDIHATKFAIDQLGALVLEGDATHDVGLVDGEAHWEGSSRQDFQTRWRVQALGAVMTGTAGASPGESEPRVGFTTAIENLDFSRLFRALSVDVSDPDEDLGSLSGTMNADGLLSDPSTLLIKQDFKFTPPKVRPAIVAKLRGDFVQDVVTNTGEKRTIRVSPVSPDFIAVTDVPAIFIRTLLIAEDAAFFAHPGVDFTELPKAIATNMARGEAARGGSTITQQTAKNLFLTREKSLHRKLKELAYTFLLESALGKQRILEIYLNIIEWGPGLYGLRPATRHYFDKDPWNLTPKEVAFLVTLIPGPVKYQASFADGSLRQGFETLVNNLLVKMRSIDVITEDQYQAALAETLVFRGTNPVPEPTGAPAKGQ